MISSVTFQSGYLLQSIQVFRRRSSLSRPVCSYKSEGVQVLQKLLIMRYMNDRVILAPNRCKLCEAVTKMIVVLAELKSEKHLDKTFIGRLFCRLDTLGYQFSEKGMASSSSATAIQRVGAYITKRYVRHESRESLLKSHIATSEVDSEIDNQTQK